MSFERARKVADAVLYEGYVLYPYRASAAKNRLRWQFGVVAPRGYSQSGGGETWAMQTECLVEPADGAVIDARVRFLQFQARTVEEAVDPARDVFRAVDVLDVGGRRLVSWDEGVEREVELRPIVLADVADGEHVLSVAVPGGRDVEGVPGPDGSQAARIVRERWPVAAVVRISAQPCGRVLKLRLRLENVGEWPAAAALDRALALRRSLIGAHTLLAVQGGRFVSLLDPPDWAAAAAATCANEHTWPVLAGPEGADDIVLSSPIILYDHPAVAAESPGDLCDATEIDEILSLRILTLTDEEKREARATDERARAILDRTESMPPEVFERLHGAIRSLETPVAAPSVPTGWEALEGPPGLDAGTDAVEVGRVRVTKGSRVRLCPSRRADAMDMFLRGRAARVEGVFRDVDGQTHLAVTVEDDPAADLHGAYGRFFYFAPDEVEPLVEDAAATAGGADR
jgi:hypothetical protein